jgi:hypothetical protein
MLVNMASLAFWQEAVAQAHPHEFSRERDAHDGALCAIWIRQDPWAWPLPWVPLLAYLDDQIPAAEASFKHYLQVLSVSMALSLVLDTIDVWTYFSKRTRI